MTFISFLAWVRGRTAVVERLAAVTAGALAAFLALSLQCLVPAAEGELLSSPPRRPLTEGKPIFEAKGCAGCHGIWSGEGTQHAGPDLGRSGSWGDLMQFAGSLWNHTPPMLAKMREQHVERPRLSPGEMGRLAGYLFYVKFLGVPGDITRGRELFDQRSCARCHQLGGRGGTAGPRLDELKNHASSLFMAQALWNHGPEMAAKMEELKLARPLLEGNDVAHIVAFIRNQGPAAMALDLALVQGASPQAGKTLMRQKGCVKCHSIGGEGGTLGPDLGKRRAQWHVAEMAAALWNHGPPMWAKMKQFGVPFRRLNNSEMVDILAYLYFVQYVGESGDAARGGSLFQEKSCSRCHAKGAPGGPQAGPDLTASAALGSPLNWASAMWNHAPAMAQKMGELQLSWPRFAGDEMRDLVAFLRSRKLGAPHE